MKQIIFSLLVLGLVRPALAQTEPGPADGTAGTRNDFSADPKP